MNIPSMRLLTLSIFASAAATLFPEPAQARARDFDLLAPSVMQRAHAINNARLARARQAARRPAANTPICALDKESGEGLTILKVPAQVSVTLVSGMPHRFSLLGDEICGDRRDNDCDGQVDENCDPDGSVPDNCGDGIVDETEECDDGNQDDSDACSNDCIARGPGLPLCGDGIVQEGEECDDGNTQNGDGCSDECKGGPPPLCGNGIVEGNEECDDGNQVEGDGCSNTCEGGDPGLPLCGDGIVQEGEECDDGNPENDDCCSNSCTLTHSSSCSPPPPVGPECQECMEDNCAAESQACLDDPECAAPRDCVLQARCLSPQLANLPCLCGSLSIAQCQQATSFPGACAEEFIESIGASDAPTLLSQWVTPTTPAGRASQAFVCMTRKCRNQCDELFDAPPPNPCGNGRVDANEECDDGNTQNGDGCSARCTFEAPRCGDRRINQDSEECDDGNTQNGDGCSASCTLEEAVCGDGKLHRYQEECDDGNTQNGDGCSSLCTVEEPRCGDGKINQDSEQCDDGNSVDDDECSNLCRLPPQPRSWQAGPQCDRCMQDRCEETNSACLNDEECGGIRDCVGKTMCLSPKLGALSCLCGSLSVAECQAVKTFPGACAEPLVRGVGEDWSRDRFFRLWKERENPTGRAAVAYACMSRECREDCAFLYEGPNPPKPVCGNAVLEKPREECDDGNTQNGDGCSANCIIERPSSEEGFWMAGPQCDACMDARCDEQVQKCKDNPQGCDPARKCMGETNCSERFLGPLPCLCGEGVKPDECLGASELGGVCAPYMIEEESKGNPQRAISRLLNENNPASSANQAFVCMGRFCREDCSNNFGNTGVRRCGNGTADSGEECDDGNTVNGDGCSKHCRSEVCGNARVDAGEQCDDGNTVSGDGCSADCQVEGECGNGQLEPSLDESCDDGNRVNGDGCSSDCQIEEARCGNAIVETDEECDDGNLDSRDGCSSDCRIEHGPGIFGDFWYSSIDCDACMFSKCSEMSNDCNTTPGCRESARCIGEQNCLSRNLGPLSCLCGEGTGVSECTQAPFGTQKGECAAEMIEGLGVNDNDNLFRKFIEGYNPTGMAHRAYVCMTRKCAVDCQENFRPQAL